MTDRSPTFPGELQYLEKSAGDPLVDFEQIFEFDLLGILIVSIKVCMSHPSLLTLITLLT